MAEASQVGEARRAAAEMAGRLGMDEARTGEVAIAVTEITGNLVKHATRGEIILCPVEVSGHRGIEILGLDHGPGITNVAECLRDGYSNGGTLGTGLGAISRLADEFDIHSVPGLGTAVLARLWVRAPAESSRTRPVEIGTVCVPATGQTACGDAWAIAQLPERCLIMVADGLGHGPAATEASRAAVESFRSNLDRSLGAMIEAADLALRHTRGAALAVADISAAARSVRYVGVGNIAGTILSPTTRRGMVSHNGTVGWEIRKIQEFQYSLPEAALVVLHSDGVSSHWDLDGYPGLTRRDPSLVAGVLYRDCRKERDDATVVVARLASGNQAEMPHSTTT
ncbi:MAG: SpoIIE family protein phosphatase [Phycisphaerales bacterium]|nr:MAG: SpoIIE family protein phosphatase [Phycisphaerales bacterium]